jgi:hypothetical protein
MRVLTRGRRWSVDEEKKLAEFVKAGVTAAEIAKTLGRSIVGVRDKSSHLGLKDDEGVWCVQSSSLSSLSSLGLNSRKTDVERSAAKVLPVEGLDAEKPLPQPAPSLVSPEVLSSPEEALRKLAAAVVALERPDLGRNEIQRLKCIILGAEKYQWLFERVAQYHKLEERLVELEEKYFELVKKRQTS